MRAHLAEILPWAHGHQLKALALFVTAIIRRSSGVQAELARDLGQQEAAVKRLGRLLHNERLAPRALADAVLAYVLPRLPKHGPIRLALDWTIEGQQHLLVVSLVIRGRAVPLFWRAYAASVLKGHMKIFERAVLKRVLTRLCCQVAARRVIFTADRAFAEENLAVLLESFRVTYVIRAKASSKVFCQGAWHQLQHLHFTTNARTRGLGRVWYCESQPRQVWVSLTRRKNAQGVWEVWYLLCNRDWPPPRAAREYAHRFGCEQGFRDAKHWLGFAQARVADIHAWSRFFALFAFALLILVALGTILLGPRAKQAGYLLKQIVSRRRGRCELSLVNAMRKLLHLDLSLLTWLKHFTRFDLEAAIPNVS